MVRVPQDSATVAGGLTQAQLAIMKSQAETLRQWCLVCHPTTSTSRTGAIASQSLPSAAEEHDEAVITWLKRWLPRCLAGSDRFFPVVLAGHLPLREGLRYHKGLSCVRLRNSAPGSRC